MFVSGRYGLQPVCDLDAATNNVALLSIAMTFICCTRVLDADLRSQIRHKDTKVACPVPRDAKTLAPGPNCDRKGGLAALNDPATKLLWGFPVPDEATINEP